MNTAVAVEKGRESTLACLELESSVKIEYPTNGFDNLARSWETLGEQVTALRDRSRQFHADLPQLLPPWEVGRRNGVDADLGQKLLSLANQGLGASEDIYAFWRGAVTRYAKETALHQTGQKVSPEEEMATQRNLSLAKQGEMVALHLRIEWHCAQSQVEMRLERAPTPGSRLHEVYDSAEMLGRVDGFDPSAARERLADVYGEVAQYHSRGAHAYEAWPEFAQRRAQALRSLK